MVGKVSAGRRKMVSNVRASIGVSVLIGLTLSVLLMLMATAPAQAQTLTDCQAEITDLKSLTVSATFLGKSAAKAEEGLLLKLDNASVKVDPVDASDLEAGADKAIACVQGLIDAQAPTAA